MIKKNQRILNFLNAVSDGVIVLCAYLFAAWLWLDVLQGTNNMAAVDNIRNGMGTAASLYALAMVVLLAVFGAYSPIRTKSTRAMLAAVWKASLLGLVAVGAALYLFRLEDFSRGVLAVFLLTSLALLSAKRVISQHILWEMRSRGYNQKHVLVVGTGHLARQYAKDIAADSAFGFRIDGFFGVEREGVAPYVGPFEALDAHLEGSGVDAVVIALEPEETKGLQSIIAVCEKSGTKVSVVPFYNDVIPAHPTLEIVGSTKLINLRSNPLDNLGYASLKRVFDLLVSGLLLALLSPVLLVVAVGTKLSSPGPVLFKQQRVGRNKTLFMMYKFRSMRVNAQQNSAWTTDQDPRKTAFGSFIRKFSIDELPQLFNVLKGDMSLVGPRPEIPFYVEQFKESIHLYMVKHQVRPGMTGWAQVNGYRGDTSIAKRIEYDIWYIENWSFGLDMRILGKTLLGGWMNREKVSRGRGGMPGEKQEPMPESQETQSS